MRKSGKITQINHYVVFGLKPLFKNYPPDCFDIMGDFLFDKKQKNIIKSLTKYDDYRIIKT